MSAHKFLLLCVRRLMFFGLLGIPAIPRAQNIVGHVYSLNSKGEKEAVAGANIRFAGLAKITSTDANGQFTLAGTGKDSAYLVVAYKGLTVDSALIAGRVVNSNVEFILPREQQLKEVAVTASQAGTLISRFNVLKTEQISKTGLMKMACCNLAESFENSATITVGYADAVSGARQVQLLGLSGIYSQVLGENIPVLRGLSSTYGWNYIPGSWLESIQISKGASSVVNGYESVTGQINLEFKKPDKTEEFFAELYADEYFKYEANITGARKINDNLWTNLLVQGSTQTNINYQTGNTTIHDRNSDHFMDMPLTKSVNVFNRWLYISPSKRVESRTGARFLYDDRQGGQSPLCHKADVYYITDVDNLNFNIYNKTGIAIGSKPGQSIGIINSFTTHKLDSYFGSDKTYKLYNGTQNTFYSNVIFNSYIGNTNHQYAVGASFLYDNFKTVFRDKLPENNTPLTPLNRTEVVPGAFAQYTYSYLQKFTLIVGLREDFNYRYGWLFTPRTNVKYSVTPNIVLRASAGCGYRSPNVIADNIGLMASTRKFDIDAIDNLQIEKAWNYGGNATFYLPVWNREKLTLSLEYFHTEFEKQAIVDLDRNRNYVYFYNLNGRSFADVWQADISFTALRGFDVFTAFRYNRNRITLNDGQQSYEVDKPLISRYRGLVNLSYATKFKKWVFDFTAQVNGPSRLPSATGYTAQANESPAYPMYFFQITKNTKRLDVYLGIENILDYQLQNPIINAENPFVKGFDASQVWGPTMGRKIYAGVRFRVGKIY
ncbi:MAG: TonB-dependent receptor [Bacteroidota bacterium]|nr:TonB-dependent receptor [Bacteroidota bacterium]